MIALIDKIGGKADMCAGQMHLQLEPEVHLQGLQEQAAWHRSMDCKADLYAPCGLLSGTAKSNSTLNSSAARTSAATRLLLPVLQLQTLGGRLLMHTGRC